MIIVLAMISMSFVKSFNSRTVWSAKLKRKTIKLLLKLNASFSCKSSVRQKRSEEHTSELQSRFDLVCRLLLEKKNRDTASCDNYKIATERASTLITLLNGM